MTLQRVTLSMTIITEKAVRSRCESTCAKSNKTNFFRHPQWPKTTKRSTKPLCCRCSPWVEEPPMSRRRGNERQTTCDAAKDVGFTRDVLRGKKTSYSSWMWDAELRCRRWHECTEEVNPKNCLLLICLIILIIKGGWSQETQTVLWKLLKSLWIWRMMQEECREMMWEYLWAGWGLSGERGHPRVGSLIPWISLECPWAWTWPPRCS